MNENLKYLNSIQTILVSWQVTIEINKSYQTNDLKNEKKIDGKKNDLKKELAGFEPTFPELKNEH